MMQPGLSLYAFSTCPYCQRVFSALDALDVEVEIKDIHRDPDSRRALLQATGSGTVPVLRIEEQGEVRWLPESRDIIAYLYQRFGKGEAPPTLGLANLDGYLRMGMWGLLLAGAVLGGTQRDPFWLAACVLGAGRAFSAAKRTGNVWQLGIGGVFGLGAVSIGLTMAGVASIPWWYAAYALIAVLLVLAVWQRVRARTRRDGSPR
ncbi:MAG: hypothetical protein GXP55_14255 [Deltaproteobacteria bacterium]|nr:hypothetical protein [Deltaproteobacteria bacterium]